MGKVANGRLGLVAALAASALGLAPVACNHARAERNGIDLTVTIPPDIKVKEVTYMVSGNGIKPTVGRFNAAQPQQQFETIITRLPPGEKYHVAVAAKSIDAKHSCSSELMVDVRKNAVTRAHATLACKGGDGSIVISVGVACTKVHLATYTVSPLAATLGGTIAVAATPLPVDAGTLVYYWSAPAGRFDDEDARQTVYTCEAAGRVRLSLLIFSDLCQESFDIEVDCLDPFDAGAKDARGG